MTFILDDCFPSFTTAPRIQLNELSDYWVELVCCKGTKLYPVKTLAAKRPTALLGNVLPKFKCTACQKGPEKIYLNETPHRTEHQGSPAGRSVDLSLLSSVGVSDRRPDVNRHYGNVPITSGRRYLNGDGPVSANTHSL